MSRPPRGTAICPGQIYLDQAGAAHPMLRMLLGGLDPVVNVGVIEPA